MIPLYSVLLCVKHSGENAERSLPWLFLQIGTESPARTPNQINLHGVLCFLLVYDVSNQVFNGSPRPPPPSLCPLLLARHLGDP